MSRNDPPKPDIIAVNYVPSRGYIAGVRDVVGVAPDPTTAMMRMFRELVKRGGILHLDLSPTYTQSAVDQMMWLKEHQHVAHVPADFEEYDDVRG